MRRPVPARASRRRDSSAVSVVHRSADGHLLVLGLVLADLGRSGAVDAILRELPAECGPEIELHDVDLAPLVPENLTVIRYSGSLTTAPFTERVNWNVSPFPIAASRSGLRRLQRLFPRRKVS